MTVVSLDRASAPAARTGPEEAAEASARPSVSIVIPLFNEHENLQELVARVEQAMVPTGRAFELILVDDGSSDGSQSILSPLARERPWLHPPPLIPNYGQSTARQS